MRGEVEDGQAVPFDANRNEKLPYFLKFLALLLCLLALTQLDAQVAGGTHYPWLRAAPREPHTKLIVVPLPAMA